MINLVRGMTAAIALVTVTVVVALGTPALAQDAPRGNADNGKRIYLSNNCFTCHGRVGQGGAYNGPTPSLAKTALPFEGFKFQLRMPVRDMPAYAEMIMSDQDVADIYAFVQSLPGRRDTKDFPLLNN
jgi:mono/diheme cytochrome c family protein